MPLAIFCHQVHILKDQVKDMNSILLFSKFSFLQLPGAPTRPLAKIAALCRSSFPLSGRHLTITSALRPSSLNLAPSAPSSNGFTQIQLSPILTSNGQNKQVPVSQAGPCEQAGTICGTFVQHKSGLKIFVLIVFTFRDKL